MLCLAGCRSEKDSSEWRRAGEIGFSSSFRVESFEVPRSGRRSAPASQEARSKVAAWRTVIELLTLLLFVLDLFAQPVYIDQSSPDAPIDDRVLITPV
jgi:hypothetical protein